MAEIELTYTNAQRDRNGRVQYWYFRRHGRRWRLPGKPLSAEFMARYHELLAETAPGATAYPPTDRRTYAHGSFGALVNDYLASGGFREKKPATQRYYRSILEALQQRDGHNPVRALERRHVRSMRDERADTPATANMIVRVLKLILNFAVEDGLIVGNPAARFKMLKIGEWRSWTDEECAAFEERWPSGTMERRAYALSRYLGQRRSDTVLMTKAHRKNGGIRVVQQKTGKELWIPEHKDLTAELAAGDQGHMSLLTTSQGKAFTPGYLGGWFAEAIDKAGLPDDCVLHGLRKVAARKLAEAGCTESQAQAVTGHDDPAMFQYYAKAANQAKLASAAIIKLENTK